MWQVFEKLYANEDTRHCCVLPVGLLTRDKEDHVNDPLIQISDRDDVCDALMFHKLPADVFNQGVPVEDDDFKLFIMELKKVLCDVHAAGVVHLDLYPSNIFWRKLDDSNVEIRLID